MQEYNVPNIKDVPENCKHLVKKGDVVYVVPGDGCCGPNCGAAWLFKDEVFGKKLRSAMNIFFADHWYDHYQYLSQCSPGHPFIRKVKGENICFEDPERLIEYLKTSEEAENMWSDSEDLAVLADMYQIKIKVITTKGEMDDKPTVNWITPDPAMTEYAELKEIGMEEMILLHEKDMHFNLVVPGDSDLATLGSLSYRFNIGPMLNRTEKVKENEEKIAESEKDEAPINEVEELRKELKKSLESKKLLEAEYKKCEKELRFKTEETLKLKIEIKDLKEIVKLRKELDEMEVEDGDIGGSREESKLLKMKENGYRRKTPQAESSPNKPTGRAKTEEFNCNDCFYQGTSRDEISKHINLKHRVEEQRDENLIKCKNCGEQFRTKWNLMYHRKSKHLNTVAYCKNNLEGKCPYSDEMCWWNHVERRDECVECYICNETFQAKATMMIHRKKAHNRLIKSCTQYALGMCRFKQESCWFEHGQEDTVERNKENIPENVEKDETEQVFQKVSENLKPPIKNKE